jgi:hypothetical protein
MTQQLKRSLGNLDAVVLSLSFDPSDTPEDLRRFKDTHELSKELVRGKGWGGGL